jgi:hypothetical protein
MDPGWRVQQATRRLLSGMLQIESGELIGIIIFGGRCSQQQNVAQMKYLQVQADANIKKKSSLCTYVIWRMDPGCGRQYEARQ